MKSASSGLINLLNSGQQLLMADLYTFTLADGTVYRCTTCDIDLTVGGNLFTSTGPAIKRSNTKTVLGVEVDGLKITVASSASVLIEGVPILQAFVKGLFDGAIVQLGRVFMPTWGDTSLGAVNLFTGRISDIICGQIEAEVTVKSDLELLNIMMPRNIYQPGCIHTLYDAGCTLNKASFGVNGSVVGVGTTTTVWCNLTQASGYFSLGTITFTGGANNGISRTVKVYSLGVFTLMFPLGVVPAPGDTFTAYPGCDKQQSTCQTKFNNVANFRGFPYIPVPETAY